MKRTLFITLTLLLFINFNGNSQISTINIGENSQIPEGAIMIDENAVFKDESGKSIDFSEFLKFMETGKWRSDAVKSENGKDEYFQLRKANSGEKGMDTKIPDLTGSLELIGENAPTFKMKDINGNSISSDDTKGKVVVLNFGSQRANLVLKSYQN